MTMDFRFVLTSSVGDRDGMSVELYRDLRDAPLGEVFRNDDTGELTVTLFEPDVPVDGVEQLLARARAEL